CKGIEKKEIISCDAVILATGGASYRATGSTGDGYKLASLAGHRIIKIRPALVPLNTFGNTASRLQGVSLRNVNVSAWFNGKKRLEKFGEMLFTHFGVTGPVILNLSRNIVDALNEKQRVELSIDLKPALNHKELDKRILRDLSTHGKKQFNKLLKLLLPKKLIAVCIDETGIPSEKIGHQILAGDRAKLKNWLKDFRLKVTGYRPINEAIITAGGVDTREIDPKTMESRLKKGLYFAGEVLDVDADTGGYNLQAAFSTGVLSGTSVSRK
ncbi:MAG: aminoacetone oxidase family FAD-binding enzyme, partial [Candidatus Aureabacteria bacterium]|nr:aminoacetone oxidase family FAD-binding enzyme [Candidatus Auribacterota bacterium]